MVMVGVIRRLFPLAPPHSGISHFKSSHSYLESHIGHFGHSLDRLSGLSLIGQCGHSGFSVVTRGQCGQSLVEWSLMVAYWSVWSLMVTQ